MRLRLASTLVGVMCLGAAVTGAPPASACSALGDHCYGIAVWDPATAPWGVAVDVLPSCLSVPSTGQNFMTDELWLVGSGDRWVEVGWDAERNINPSPWPQGTWVAYWADKNDNGYWEHLLDSSPAHTRAHLDIYRNGSASNQFYVHFAGIPGLSQANSMVADYAEAGAEATTPNGHSYGSWTLLKHSDGSSWISKWSSPSATTVVNTPNTFAWSTQNANFWAGVPC